MIRYVFGAYFKQFSLSSPDVNKNKGVAEMAPFKDLGFFLGGGGGWSRTSTVSKLYG